MRTSGRGTRSRQRARHRWDALFAATDDSSSELMLADRGPGPALEQEPDDAAGRFRWRLSLRVGFVLAAILVAVGGLWWFSAASAAPAVESVQAPRPPGEGLEESADGGGSPSRGGEPPSSAPSSAGGRGSVVVHVAGAVVSPGVYTLPAGARVTDAVAAAGGAVGGSDVHRLNLAAPAEDGARIHVPRVGEPDSPSEPAAASAPGTASRPPKVNLNTASVEELGALPRVGAVLAQRIVDFRTAHGRFKAPEDLDAVDGIGPKMLESLLPLVTV